MKRARPTSDYDGLYERRSDWTSDMFVEAIYRDLTQGEAMILRSSRGALAAAAVLMIATATPERAMGQGAAVATAARARAR